MGWLARTGKGTVMEKMRNLMLSLFLVAGAMASAHAAAAQDAPAANGEHDAELRAEKSEPFSRGLIAILIINACVVATGVRVARYRAQRDGQAGTAGADPDQPMPDVA